MSDNKDGPIIGLLAMVFFWAMVFNGSAWVSAKHEKHVESVLEEISQEWHEKKREYSK